MKTKAIIVSILATSCVLGSILMVSNKTQSFFTRADEHVCSGNHYEELKETESSDGVKEYWVCCTCYNKYFSTKEIPHYDKSKWQDAGSASLVEGYETRKFASPLSDVTTKPGSTGFSVDGNSFVGSTSSNGWIMSNEKYFNYSVDISVDSKATHNPWGDHYCTNSFIINGNSDNGRLYGYVLDFQKDFVQLSYLPNIAEREENHGGNVFFAQGGGLKSVHIHITEDVFTLSSGGEVLQTVKLNRHWYQEGSNNLCENVYYVSGSIGYLGYADDDTTHYARKMTISNFVKKDSQIFANTQFNADNDYSLSNNAQTITTTTNAGYMYTNKSYTDFSLKVHVDAGAHENIFGDHTAKNSILIGGGYENGHLTGYVLEFQENHVELAKLNGSSNYSTGNASVIIGYWGGDGAFGVGGKDIFVKVSGGELTVSSMDGAWRPSGKDEYPSGSVTLDSYSGGSLGYLFNDSTAHTINVTKLG